MKVENLSNSRYQRNKMAVINLVNQNWVQIELANRRASLLQQFEIIIWFFLNTLLWLNNSFQPYSYSKEAELTHFCSKEVVPPLR